MDHYTPLGYGSSGVVVYGTEPYPPHALKLYSAPADEAAILREGSIQAAAVRTLLYTLRVPKVHTVTRRPVVFDGADYIAGIYMDPVPGHTELNGAQLHIPLGADLEHDEWHPGGFFPTVDTFYQTLVFRESYHTIASISRTMGRAHRALLDAGIIPDHVKFLYGADDHIWMIGFRHCRTGYMDPLEWVQDRRREVEPYAPHEDQWGYEEYMEAFLESRVG